MKVKQIIAGALVLVMGLSMVGCGNSKTSASGALENEYVRIKQYKNLPIEVTKDEVTDSDVEQYISSQLETDDGSEAPELTNEKVKELSETSTTVEEYKAEVKKILEDELASSQDYEKRVNLSAVFSAQLEEIRLPNDKVEMMKKLYSKTYTDMAENYNLEYEKFCNDVLGMDPEDVAEEIKGYAEEDSLLAAACELIAEKEGLIPTSNEYTAEFEKIAAQENITVADLEDKYGKDYLKMVVINQRVFDFLLENCSVTEVDPDETEAEGTYDENGEYVSVG